MSTLARLTLGRLRQGARPTLARITLGRLLEAATGGGGGSGVGRLEQERLAAWAQMRATPAVVAAMFKAARESRAAATDAPDGMRRVRAPQAGESGATPAAPPPPDPRTPTDAQVRAFIGSMTQTLGDTTVAGLPLAPEDVATDYLTGAWLRRIDDLAAQMRRDDEEAAFLLLLT